MTNDNLIYFGTASNPNPYEQDATPEQIAERQRKIDDLVDHLLSGKCKPSDLLQEDCFDLVDMLIVALWAKLNIPDRTPYEECVAMRYSNALGISEDACIRRATWLIDSGNNTVTMDIKKKLGVDYE